MIAPGKSGTYRGYGGRVPTQHTYFPAGEAGKAGKLDLNRYIQSSLKITQGEGAGEPLRLFHWERRFLRGAMKPDVSTAALTVARGNGKTTLSAAIAVAALDGPLVQNRAEIVLVASSFGQAKILFEHCLAFLEPVIIRDGEGKHRRWRIQDSANLATIEDRRTGARVRCIGSDPRRAHGLAPRLVLADEPAQWEPSKSEKMLAALETGLGKIQGSRLVALGTRPSTPDHWFSKMLLQGGADYAQVHAARAGTETVTENESVRRFCGYLLLSEETLGVVRSQRTGESDMEVASNHAMGFRNSGAESLLTPFKKRRGGLI